VLKLRPYWWGLLLVGLIFAGAIAVAASLLKVPEGLPWSLTAVDVVEEQKGGAHLLVNGEGLHKGIKAILIPETTVVKSIEGPVALSLNLYHFATDGQLAVATTRDHRLLTIDVTNGFNPRILGGLKLTQLDFFAKVASITSLALVGSKVVVNSSSSGLALVDVSDPAKPQQVDFLQNREGLLDLQAQGERVYAVSNKAGLFTVTMEDNQLTSRLIPGSRPAMKLTVDGDRLVTAAPSGELAFYDLDGQGRPHLSGTLKLTTKIFDLVLAQGALFVCTAAGDLLEFNLAAWPHPALAGKLSLKGRPLKLEWNESTRQLFSILVGDGVAVVDISQAGKPQSEGFIPLAKVLSVTGCDDRLFAAGINGLVVLSTHDFVRDQSPPKIVYPLSPSSGGSNLLSWESALFIYNFEKLKLLSVSRGDKRTPDVAQPENLPFLVLPDRTGVRLHAIREGMPMAEVLKKIPVYDEAVEVSSGGPYHHVKKAFWRAGHIYALSDSKVSIFGVDDSGEVLSREEFQLQTQVKDMDWLSGGFLVLATDEPALRVLDVRRPGAYRVIGEYPLAKYQRDVGAVKSLLVDGARLYAARGRLGVEVYDLDNPAAPRLLQRIDTPGYALHLNLYDGLLLTADKDHGTFIVDVSGEQALVVGSCRLATSCMETFCSENELYVINSADGVLRLQRPLRLPAADFVSEGELGLAVPSGVAPGHYRLVLYDEEGTDSHAVNLN